MKQSVIICGYPLHWERKWQQENYISGKTSYFRYKGYIDFKMIRN